MLPDEKRETTTTTRSRVTRLERFAQRRKELEEAFAEEAHKNPMKYFLLERLRERLKEVAWGYQACSPDEMEVVLMEDLLSLKTREEREACLAYLNQAGFRKKVMYAPMFQIVWSFPNNLEDEDLIAFREEVIRSYEMAVSEALQETRRFLAEFEKQDSTFTAILLDNLLLRAVMLGELQQRRYFYQLSADTEEYLFLSKEPMDFEGISVECQKQYIRTVNNWENGLFGNICAYGREHWEQKERYHLPQKVVVYVPQFVAMPLMQLCGEVSLKVSNFPQYAEGYEAIEVGMADNLVPLYFDLKEMKVPENGWKVKKLRELYLSRLGIMG